MRIIAYFLVKTFKINVHHDSEMEIIFEEHIQYSSLSRKFNA